MVELCLMASHGCPPGLGVVLHQEQASNRPSEGLHQFLPCHVPKQDLIYSSISLNLNMHQNFQIDSTPKRPALIKFQGAQPDSVHFSMGIAERCARHEKILKLLASGSLEEQDLLDLAELYDMMVPQVIIADLAEQDGSCSRWCFKNDQPVWSLVYPTKELYFNEPLLGLTEDRNDSDVQLQYDYTLSEMNDIMSALSDFYNSKNTNKSSKQTLLVPYFESTS